MDLIDRQAITEHLRNRIDMQDLYLPIHIIQLIDELPTIETVPRWIPVTERLPEESDGTILVCMPNVWPYNYKEPFINAKHNCQVETATHSEHSGNWYFSGGAVGDVEPIAWMPLPDPYKEV